jgi:hypothetical protein
VQASLSAELASSQASPGPTIPSPHLALVAGVGAQVRIDLIPVVAGFALVDCAITTVVIDATTRGTDMAGAVAVY